MSKRRVFTREFKVEAVALVSRQGLSFAEAARRLEIGQNLLRKWRDQLAEGGSKVFSAKAQPTALEEEVRRLRAENDRLTMVDSKGETCDAVVIGDGTPNFERFLLTYEPTFDEFLKSHPLSKQIGQGATFRPRIFARIAKEYRLKLAEKSFR